MIVLKTEKEIELMFEAGQLNYACHEEIRKLVKPGVSTAELDRVAEDYIRSHGARPAFKGYMGYPATINASLNEEVVHGIPSDDIIIQEGDLVSIDLGVVLNGYYADSANTWAAGEISAEKERLRQVTQSCLMEGIRAALTGGRLGDISQAVQKMAESNGYSVVRDLVGHGIGRKMHEDPKVPNFGRAGTGPRLREGMVIAIEPMINMGAYHVDTLDDDWTVVTRDGKPSAHFEHTVAITKNGPRVLTAPEGSIKL